MMHTLLEVGLSNALAAAALAALAVVVAGLCRQPRLVHALWLLVLVKILTPPLVRFEIDWSNSPSANLETAAAPATSFVPETRPAEPLALSRETLVARLQQLEQEPPAEESLSFHWVEVIVVMWIAGSAIWFLWTGICLVSFCRLVRKSATPSPELQARVNELSAQLGLRRPPTLVLLPGRLSPMVWAALGRPRLLLPANLLQHLTGSQRDTLILHELAHLRRHDHWVRWLELLASGLYWWLPVVWLARRGLHRAEEECCDACVLRTLPNSERDYAQALVQTLAFLSPAPRLPAAASGIGTLPQIKRRLTMIFRQRSGSLVSRIVGVAALGVALLALPWAPSLAQNKDAQPSARDIRQKQIEVLKQLLKSLEEQQQVADPGSVDFLVPFLNQQADNPVVVDPLLMTPRFSTRYILLKDGTVKPVTSPHADLLPTIATPPPPITKDDDRIRPGDRLYIHLVEGLPGEPVKGVYRVEPTGKVALGPSYGRVAVGELTIEEAEARIQEHLAKLLRNARVLVTRYDPLSHGGTGAQELLEAEARAKRLKEELDRLSKPSTPFPGANVKPPLKPETTSERQFEVIRLKHTTAPDMALALDELFNGKRNEARIERVRIVADAVSNTLLIQANPADAKLIRDLLDKALDSTEQPNPWVPRKPAPATKPPTKPAAVQGEILQIDKLSKVLNPSTGVSHEMRDTRDPVEVGKRTSYVIVLSNKGGTAPENQVVVRVVVPPQLRVVSAKGPSAETVANQVITFAPVDVAPGQTLEFTIECDALQKGDARFRVEFSSPTRQPPTFDEERTLIID